ncbi:MAG: M3 family oligoendopeptidase [Clostridiales bacterium]|nr:M3 family oligoendopeptidase [Clostridiales bacterium]
MHPLQGALKRPLVLLTALMLLLAPLASAAGAAYFEDIPRSEVPYAQMVYERYDLGRLQGLLEQLAALCSAPGNDRAVSGLLETLLKEADLVETQYALADIAYYKDVEDPLKQQEQAHMRAVLENAYDLIFEALAEVLRSGGYNEVIASVIGEELARSLKYYEPLSDYERALGERENELIQTYYSLETGGLSDEQYNGRVGSLYLSLRDLRMEMARVDGSDSYADMASSQYFGRDYSLRDIRRFCNLIKQIISPTYRELYDRYTDKTQQALDAVPELPPDRLIEMLGRHIGKLGPEMQQSYDHLVRLGLYDIEKSDRKAAVGFTTALPAYGTAFIFDAPTDSPLSNFGTLVHEFGHFTNDYYSSTPAMLRDQSFDLFEVHSQGLELLFFPYYEDLFGAGAPHLIQYQLDDLLYAIVYYAYLAELEIELYSHPEYSLQDINRRSGELLEAYGISFSYLPLKQDLSWIYSDHLITSPLYSISYAISGMAALDIWMQSLTDYERAVDTYLRLLSYDTTLPFFDAMEAVGIGDIFTEGYARSVADTLHARYGSPFSFLALSTLRFPVLAAGGLLLLALPFLLWRLLARRRLWRQ